MGPTVVQPSEAQPTKEDKKLSEEEQKRLLLLQDLERLDAKMKVLHAEIKGKL